MRISDIRILRIKGQIWNWRNAVLTSILTPMIAGCPGAFPATIVTDVPCITPDWGPVAVYGFRNEQLVDGRLLFTAQTLDQFTEDIRDNGVSDRIPHLAVFAYDVRTETLESVDDEIWDSSEAPVRVPIGGGGSEQFLIVGFGQSQLVYMDEAVPVVGGTAAGVFVPLGGGPVVAVVSTTGARSFPPLGNGSASGQYYHQLFSEETGGPVEASFRLGLGNGREPIGVVGAWSSDGRYVVYRSVGTFCIAPGLSE